MRDDAGGGLAYIVSVEGSDTAAAFGRNAAAPGVQ